jgi:hypothetical protein
MRVAYSDADRPCIKPDGDDARDPPIETPATWIDRLLPRNPRAFLVLIVMIAGGTWLLGLAIANDRTAFLMSPEWRVQPLLLTGHLVALRLFVTAYAVNFLRGAHYLRVSEAEPRAWVENVLQPFGAVIALGVAAPFIVMDVLELDTYLLQPELGRGAADILMLVVWSVEWVVNAYIWIILVRFATLTVWAVSVYPFHSSTDVLLQEKQYRPFLAMGVHGSTILLLFGVLYSFYVWYADGEATDFVSLGITAALLLGCFVPPWLTLKNGLEGQVRREIAALSTRLSALRQSSEGEAGDSHDEKARIHQEEIITLLRMAYLDRLQQELGRSEGRAVIMRLLVPASTIAWKFVRPIFLGL